MPTIYTVFALRMYYKENFHSVEPIFLVNFTITIIIIKFKNIYKNNIICVGFVGYFNF